MEKANRNLYIFIFLIITSLSVNAQEIDVKKQVNNIKRDSEYIWGQSSGDDFQMAYDIAYNQFIDKLNDYINSDDELREASAIIMTKLKSQVKDLSFERGMDVTVVCVYIHKDDLLPLYTKDNPNSEVTILAPKQERIVQEVASSTPVIEESENEEATTVDNTQTQPELSDQPLVETKHGITERTNNEIISQLLTLSSYNEQINYLQARKDNDHDVIFKLVKDPPTTGMYWIIYDSSRKMIALLSSDLKTDLLNNQQILPSQYNSAPKMWIKVYNE